MRVGEISITPITPESKGSTQFHRGPYGSQVTPAAGRLDGSLRDPPNPGSAHPGTSQAPCPQVPAGSYMGRRLTREHQVAHVAEAALMTPGPLRPANPGARTTGQVSAGQLPNSSGHRRLR